MRGSVRSTRLAYTAAMTPRRLSLPCLLGGLALLAGCQSAELPSVPLPPHPMRPVPDVAGIRLGDTLASVQARFAGAHCKAVDAEDITEQCVIGGLPFAQAGDAVAYVSFAGERTVIVQAYGLPATGMALMVQALTARYGAPDDERHRPPHARPPAVSWSTDDWFLVATPAGEGQPFAGAILYQRAFVLDVQRAAARRGENVSD
ncbi:hypothetical protein ISP17_15400 [Dyella ginsengisoli]|uniref:Uncharacterized protein n=1 Tax=Dyella ginsengisoli TaxID=363848 RepID=A0ABW8JWW5_9GAMM